MRHTQSPSYTEREPAALDSSIKSTAPWQPGLCTKAAVSQGTPRDAAREKKCDLWRWKDDRGRIEDEEGERRGVGALGTHLNDRKTHSKRPQGLSEPARRSDDAKYRAGE